MRRLLEEGVDIYNKEVSMVSPWLCICIILAIPKPEGSSVTLLDAYTKCVKFTLLYIYIDNYLDRKDISRESKKEFMVWMRDPTTITCNVLCVKLLRIKEELESYHPNAKVWLQQLTDNTIESVITQYTPGIAKKCLKSMCFDKGSITLLVIYRLIYGDQTREEATIATLGSCVQLLDDIVDCTDDISNGINTYCTRTLKKSIYMDRCAKVLSRMLDSLDNIQDYCCIVSVIRIALRYTVMRSNYFSIKQRLAMRLPPYCVKTLPSFLQIVDTQLRSNTK